MKDRKEGTWKTKTSPTGQENEKSVLEKKGVREIEAGRGWSNGTTWVRENFYRKGEGGRQGMKMTIVWTIIGEGKSIQKKEWK